jgi:hypothetical protein
MGKKQPVLVRTFPALKRSTVSPLITALTNEANSMLLEAKGKSQGVTE